MFTHPRGRRPGQRLTSREHLPPEAHAFLGRYRVWCLAQAREVGPSCASLVVQLLADRILERVRAAQGVLALVKPCGPARVEAACSCALAHGSAQYRTVEVILSTGADLRAEATAAPAPEGYGRTRYSRTRYSRTATERFAGSSLHPQQELVH